MKQITKISITREMLEETQKSLRNYGDEGCEGLVLWLGHISENNTCEVQQVLTPPQNSIKGEDGVGYFVTSETLFSLNKFLSSSGLRLLAQVHSHPGRAYHSGADDRYCIVTVEGGFSIVVPNFGFGPLNLHQWATYRLINGIWEKLSASAVRAIFSVDGEPEDQAASESIFSKLTKIFQ